MADKAPAFQLYIDDWRGSRAVQRMTFAQRGMFLEMLIEQWDKSSLPDCPHACAELLGGTEAEWDANWPTLRRKFVDRRARPRAGDTYAPPENHDPQRQIVNLKLEKMSRERRTFKRDKQVAGQKGGEARARNQRVRRTLDAVADVAGATTAASTEVANPTSSLLFSPSSLLSSSKEQDTRARGPSVLEGALPRNHANHVFCSDTFTVCVPAPVHAKFMGLLAGRFPEREIAHQSLLAWYPTVTAPLPAEFVMADAFKFWQAKFDEAFASPLVASPSNKRIDALVRGGQKFLERNGR